MVTQQNAHIRPMCRTRLTAGATMAPMRRTPSPAAEAAVTDAAVATVAARPRARATRAAQAEWMRIPMATSAIAVTTTAGRRSAAAGTGVRRMRRAGDSSGVDREAVARVLLGTGCEMRRRVGGIDTTGGRFVTVMGGTTERRVTAMN